ncbi:hypothetical protein CRG98_019192 [Punica granatum]|uniref:Uncharacterized protein n=1 Tax=Punica granatum TaxID=22663 RepID=A0A2I0JVR5_PUNGR|nr:hypothetical protein CRG98_019192 [Punica granatum]
MDCGRKAWSTEKGGWEPSEEQTNKEPRKQRSWHCGTIHHRITEAPKGAQYGTLKIPLSAKLSGPAPLTSRRPPKTGLQAPRNHQGHGISFKRSFRTLQGSPRDVSVVANASRQIFGAHSRKSETAAIPEHLKTFREHCENPGHKSLGLPGPTVLG